MIPDYAKYTSDVQRRQPQKPKKRSWLVRLLVLSVLLLLLFTGIELAVSHLTSWRWQRVAQLAIKSDSLSQRIVASLGEGPAVSFDFYTILPEVQTYVPHEQSVASDVVGPVAVKKPAHTLSSSRVKQSADKSRPIQGDSLVLQVASVQSQEDAARLVLQLKELHFSSFIQSVKVGSHTWHRVLVGPYATHDQAVVAQRQLAEQLRHQVLLKHRF